MRQNKASVFDDNIKDLIHGYLVDNDWNIRKTARKLCLHRTRLYRLMARFKLKKPRKR